MRTEDRIAELLRVIRERMGDATWRPYELVDGPETVWVIEKPSIHRQTHYETEASAIIATALRFQID